MQRSGFFWKLLNIMKLHENVTGETKETMKYHLQSLEAGMLNEDWKHIYTPKKLTAGT